MLGLITIAVLAVVGLVGLFVCPAAAVLLLIGIAAYIFH